MARETMATSIGSWRVLAFVMTLAALAGCGASVAGGDGGSGTDGGDSGVVCRLGDGRTCPAGRSCPAPDGCNTCSCNERGELACTLLHCPDAR